MPSVAVQTKLRDVKMASLSEKYGRRGNFMRTKAEIAMRHFALITILSLGVSFALRADDQGPVEKTGKTVEKAAVKTGQTVEHGAQATERTVGKELKKTGNTLEKAGNGTTGFHRRHARTKGSTAKASPSPSPKPESSPSGSPAPTPAESAPTPAMTPAPTPETTPIPTPTPGR